MALPCLFNKVYYYHLPNTHTFIMGRVTPIQVLALSSLLIIFPNLAHAQLKRNYYANICPNVETIVRNTVTAKVRQSFITIPGTLHLFFHDCFVQGCDASVMIASSGSNTYPGAHTLGFYHCDQFTNRIYNFSKQNPVDPTLSPSYAAQLKQQCPKNVDPRIAVNMDPNTPRIFDNMYFKILQQGQGLFTSDQVLFTDSRSKPTVTSWASSPQAFSNAFVAAMTKLGRVGVKMGQNGNIRQDFI